jgi:hypothetical protein
VHAKTAEFVASQCIFFEDAAPLTREQCLKERDYADLLRACRDRLGHPMTDAERERLEAA